MIIHGKPYWRDEWNRSQFGFEDAMTVVRRSLTSELNDEQCAAFQWAINGGSHGTGMYENAAITSRCLALIKTGQCHRAKRSYDRKPIFAFSVAR